MHERALHLEVGQVISTGTFSKVYNVRQVNTKQDFALKVKNYTTETEKKVADHEVSYSVNLYHYEFNVSEEHR